MSHDTNPSDLSPIQLIEFEENLCSQAYDYFIPGHISSLPLTRDVKYFYAMIRNFCNSNRNKKRTGCSWIRNCTLADKMETSERTIQRYLHELVKHGAIVIELFEYATGGVKRCIWIKEAYELFQRFESYDADNHPSVTLIQKIDIHDKSVGVSRQIWRPLIDKDKDRKGKDTKDKERESQAPPPPPSKRKAIKEGKEEVAERVWLTPSQQNSILKKFHGNKEKLKESYKKLSEWKIKKEIIGGNDYANYTTWVYKAMDEQKSKVERSHTQLKEDRLLAEEIWKRYKGRNDVRLYAKSIEFLNGVAAPSDEWEFGSKDFRINCLDKLKKRKLNIEGL